MIWKVIAIRKLPSFRTVQSGTPNLSSPGHAGTCVHCFNPGEVIFLPTPFRRKRRHVDIGQVIQRRERRVYADSCRGYAKCIRVYPHAGNRTPAPPATWCETWPSLRPRRPFGEERTVHALYDTIRELLEEGAGNFAINLAQVPGADSYTLGALAGAYNLVRQAGGRIKFFAASERLIRAFRKFHLDSVLELYDNEASALSNLQ